MDRVEIDCHAAPVEHAVFGERTLVTKLSVLDCEPSGYSPDTWMLPQIVVALRTLADYIEQQILDAEVSGTGVIST